MPHPGRNNIYEATIKRMVNEALDAQEQEFACNRGNDSDEQLLSYLCFCTSLEEVALPKKLTHIGNFAFQDCDTIYI